MVPVQESGLAKLKKKEEGILQTLYKFKKFYEMDDLLENNLKDVVELDEKNKRPHYHYFADLNDWIVYIIALIILIQVIIGSDRKFGTIMSSTTTLNREQVQTFDFKAKDFKHFFLAEIVEDEENKVDDLADKHATETGKTWTESNDGSNLKYTLEAYQASICAHVKAGIVTSQDSHIIDYAAVNPEIKQMFFPMSCNVFSMGKGTADRDVLALIMNFEGNVTATQDSKYFRETSLTPEVVAEDKLG